MSTVNKGFELERRDVTNEVIAILNKSWLPCSVKSEIASKIAQDFMVVANNNLQKQEKEYQEAIKKEQEEDKKEGE